ncbi:retrotransposon protein, putative, ty1-copia subclass [Tanacetum coccineum]
MLFTLRETYVDCNPKMALPVQNLNHSAFRSMFEREKLSKTNFNDQFRQLKLFLRVEKKMFVIEQPIPPAPGADFEANVLAEWNAVMMLIMRWLILCSGLVLRVEKKMFVIEQPLPATSAADSEAQVRSQWNAVYDAYNEVACLILGTNGKGKDKQVYISKPKNPKPSAKEHPAKDDTCHHCKEVGHWKRNCLVYLAELLKKKKQVGIVSSSGIFTIELFAFPNKSWVYDTGCGTHNCITKQGFKEEKKMKQGALLLGIII